MNLPNLNEGEDFYYSSPISGKSLTETLKEIEEEEKQKNNPPPLLRQLQKKRMRKLKGAWDGK